MPSLTIGDVIQLRVGCYQTPQAGLNILHYKVVAITPPAPTLAEFVTTVDTSVHPLYKELLNSQSEYIGVGARILLPTPSAETSTTLNRGVGLRLGDPMPSQVAGIITKLTDLPGRANRGRMYVPFPSEESGDLDGTPVAQYVTDLTTLAASLLAPWVVTGGGGGDADLDPVVFHELTGLTTPITGNKPRDKWATQRRRGAYGATNDVPFV